MSALDNDIEHLEQVMRRLFQVMKRPQNWERIQAQAGVTIDRPAAYVLRAVLARDGRACSLQELAHELGIEAPSVTRKSQELEEAGYLKRERDEHDRRVVHLRVTASGRKTVIKLWKAQRQQIAVVLAQWPAADRKLFITLFDRFSRDAAEQLQA